MGIEIMTTDGLEVGYRNCEKGIIGHMHCAVVPPLCSRLTYILHTVSIMVVSMWKVAY
jgi:hypothetical protein